MATPKPRDIVRIPRFEPPAIIDGRVVLIPNGKTDDVVLTNVHEYSNGDLGLSYRFASNRHRGIDSSCPIPAKHIDLIVLLGHDESVSLAPRSMLS